MSRKNRPNGRTTAPRNRQPRTTNTSSPVQTGDQRALAKLGYRLGHLTDAELELFAQLRSPLTPLEVHQLDVVSKTLRRPFKRLRALDLMRYWNAPLTPSQQRMLPWFAGLTWHQPLPNTPGMPPVALARHLLCERDVPEFLFEPFAHPLRYRWPSLHWEVCRTLAIVGAGEGLAKLREYTPFWKWVPTDVYERFMASPADMPVVEALVRAFVRAWGGPDWLAQHAVRWTDIYSFSFDLHKVLRVTHELCTVPVARDQVDATAQVRLKELNALSRMFGLTQALAIPGIMPEELAGWTCTELRTPTDFDAASAKTDRYISYSFLEAKRGELSFWSLEHGEHHLLIRVDVKRRQVRHYTHHWRARDPEEQALIAAWAQANDLST